jgi:hypothetical protein
MDAKLVMRLLLTLPLFVCPGCVNKREVDALDESLLRIALDASAVAVEQHIRSEAAVVESMIFTSVIGTGCLTASAAPLATITTTICWDKRISDEMKRSGVDENFLTVRSPISLFQDPKPGDSDRPAVSINPKK